MPHTSQISHSKQKMRVTSTSATLLLLFAPFTTPAVDAETIRTDEPAAEEQLAASRVSSSRGEFRDEARFVHRTVIIPADDKRHRGGEDAAATADDILVVADGVGGWARQGKNTVLRRR